MSKLKELEAENLAIQIKMAKHIIPQIKEGIAAIDEDAGKFIVRMDAARAEIPNPSDAFSQFTNVLEVLKGVRLYFGGELERLEKLVALADK